MPGSADAVIAHLHALKRAERDEAKKYVRKTPAQVDRSISHTARASCASWAGTYHEARRAAGHAPGDLLAGVLAGAYGGAV
jgi:hypothetical protein